MYLTYFGLQEAPFSITPDPGYIYLSGRHRDALAHLLYGVGQSGSGGFVQLTGEVGTGKTTLCRALLEQVPPETHIALILNPLMNPVEMLEAICEELGIYINDVEGSSKGLVDRLNGFLLEAHSRGERVVLVIDEAQNLSIESLEQVRLLTNLETSKEKLLQIILLGQPELRELLQRRSLRQLAQRITARYHLTPLGQEDTARYVGHRLAVAGASRNPFSRSGIKALYQRSRGVPRLVNIIADRSLVAGFAAEKDRIDAGLVNAAADEVQLGEPGVNRMPWLRFAGLATAALLILALGWSGGQWLANRGPGAEDVAAKSPEQTSSPVETARTGATPAEIIAPASEMSEAPTQGEQNTALQSGPEVGVPALSQATDEPDIPMETVSEALPELDQAWFEEQHLRAWQGLAERWGKNDDAALLQASCLGREGLGFACLQDQGNWLRIRELGLPVILLLQGDSTQHLLVNGMEGDRLLVGSGASRAVVSRDDVEARWYGDYFISWPQAADWPREIGRGDTGEPVDRVMDLATRTPEPYTGAAVFDESFERWLVDFQGRNGLEADGIVGPKTLLYLMRYSIEEPRLVTSLAGGG